MTNLDLNQSEHKALRGILKDAERMNHYALLRTGRDFYKGVRDNALHLRHLLDTTVILAPDTQCAVCGVESQRNEVEEYVKTFIETYPETNDTGWWAKDHHPEIQAHLEDRHGLGPGVVSMATIVAAEIDRVLADERGL